jgi:hypothetical protein
VEALPSFLFGCKKLALLPFHCFVDNLSQYGAAWLPLTLLRLKPKVGFFIDVNYNSRHGAEAGLQERTIDCTVCALPCKRLPMV